MKKNDNNNFEEQDSITVKVMILIVSIVLIIVLITASLTDGFRNFNPYGWFDKEVVPSPPYVEAPKEIGTIDDNPMFDNEVYDIPQKVVFSTHSLEETATGGITEFVKVNILPASATNKNFKIDVYWADVNNTSFVAEYVSAERSRISESIAITCYKAFEGAIIVEFTTEDGDFSANCYLSCDLVLWSFDVNCKQDIYSNGAFRFKGQQTYEFVINGVNPIGNPPIDLVFEPFFLESFYYFNKVVAKYSDDKYTAPVLRPVSDFGEHFIKSCTLEGNILKIETGWAMSNKTWQEDIISGDPGYYTCVNQLIPLLGSFGAEELPVGWFDKEVKHNTDTWDNVLFGVTVLDRNTGQFINIHCGQVS